MHQSLLSFASRILASSTRQRPADAVLRAELKQAAHLTPQDKRAISELVFTYYRWKGWLDRKYPYEARLLRALELAERFHRNPFTLPTAALAAKAVPSWTHEQLEPSAPWLRSLQRPPNLWLRARPGQARSLARSLGHAQPSKLPALPDALLYQGDDDLFRTEAFAAGQFEIQDIASQAVGACCQPAPGQIWWDACAGQGGKTLHLADLMQNRGLVWASDRAHWRLDQLRRRAARAQLFNLRPLPWDGGPRPPTKTFFDGILVDAPCSGVGTWGRNPHARWTTSRADVAELAQAQIQLLHHVAPSLKPGGLLLYAACTLTRAETHEVANAWESAHPDFEPAPLLNPFQPAHPPQPRLLLWPQDTHGNGMFIAAWRRRPNP